MLNQTIIGLTWRRQSRRFIFAAAVFCMMSLGLGGAWAAPPPCDFPGQTRMLTVQLFMGLDMPDHTTVTPAAWDRFLGSVVTPRFPDGFTVYDAYGQWWNPETKSISKERSKVIVIVVDDSPGALAGITQVSDAYKTQFRQLSVGIVSNDTCASF